MDPQKEISITTTVNATPLKVWECWTTPSDIVRWNNVAPDWHTPHAQNDVTENGRFLFRMEAKDGSAGFDFSGVYQQVIPHQLIGYTISDGRKVTIRFTKEGNTVRIDQTFEAETENTIELQRAGWQAILDNFKIYTENEKH